MVLKAVIAKCGKHNALVEPIAWANSREELEVIESAWIAKARQQYGANCLNRHDGGTGGKMPDEVIKQGIRTKNAKWGADPLGYAVMIEKQRRSMIAKIRSPEQIAETTRKRLETRSKKTYTAWNAGVPMTDAAKAKASASLKGKPGPNKGKTFGPETRAKQSASRKGKRFTDEHRAKMKAGSKRAIPFLNLATGEIHPSLTEACSVLKLSYSSMKKRIAKGTVEQFGLRRIQK